MKVQLKVFALLIAGFFVACGGNNGSQQAGGQQKSNAIQQEMEDETWDEVMEIHDEVMPEMTTINRINKQLKTALETNAVPATDSSRVRKAVDQLTAADEAMWSWMHELVQIDRLRQDKGHTEIMEYLNNEKVKIAKVRMEMVNSIKVGNDIITELNLEAESKSE